MKTNVTIVGPVTATTVVWRLGQKLRVTVIAKACLTYGEAAFTELMRPTSIVIQDRESSGEIQAVSDLAPFIPTPEVMVIGRPPHKQGRARVGFRLERAGATLIDKHVDAVAGAPLLELGPRRSGWPVQPIAFSKGIVALDSADGDVYQRAAKDQRVLEIRGSDELVLIGLSPATPLLRFELRAPTVSAAVSSGAFEAAVPFRIDALTVSLGDRRCTLIWRGSVPLPSEDLLAGLRVRVTAVPDPRSSSGAGESMGTVAMGEGDAPAGAATPWDAHTLPRVAPAAMGGVAQESTTTIGLEDPDSIEHLSLPFAKTPASPRAEVVETNPLAATPWAREAPKPVKRAEGVMETLPAASRPEALEEMVAEKPVAMPVAASVATPIARSEPESPPSSPWREEAAAPAAPPQVKIPDRAPKQDLKPFLYRKPKAKR